MIKIIFSEKEIDEFEYERYHYPDPKVQRKMEVLYLKSQNIEHQFICSLCRISSVTLVEYFRQYIEGGIERLKLNLYRGKKNDLTEHKDSLEKYFNENPPRSTKEAKNIIEERTGIKRGMTQVREFLKRIGLKYRKVGTIPGKTVDDKKIAEQESFKKDELIPKLNEAKNGKRDIFLWMPLTSSMKDI